MLYRALGMQITYKRIIINESFFVIFLCVILLICLSIKQNLGHVWFLGSHILGKLILFIIYLSIKQNFGHAWFLESHTLGKLILIIIYLSVK